LQAFFDNEYMPKYAEQYKKESSCNENKRIFNRHFSHISNRGLNSFTKLEIDTLHKEIGKNSGLYMANRVLCLIRHVFNVAINWGYIEKNPATGIKQYPEKSRDRFIQPEEMIVFMETLNKQKNVQLRQLVMLLLLTGQRKSNIMSIKWSYIDFHNNMLYLPETKNGESQRIPLTNQAIELLNEIRETQAKQSEYVFASNRNKSGHINSLKTFWTKVLQEAKLDNLRIHDLRRTMGSYQAITGSSLHIIGKSLGHKSTQSTEIYARLNLDSVRSSMQKATDLMFNIG